MTSFRYRLAALAAAAALSVVACNKGKTTSSASSTSAQSELAPDTVVATVGSETVTVAQLDEHLKAQLQQLQDSYQKQKFQMRRQGLDQMLMEKLIKAEAAKKGMTQEQYLKAEVEDKIPPPSEEKIQEVFNQNAAQLPPGSKLETYRPQIISYLARSQRQERVRSVFEQLRKENQVAIKLSEPRKQVEAKGPARGPDNARVTMVEFSDFQCPFCSRAHDTVEQVMQAYAGKVRLVFRQFPLDIHKNAAKAAEAALCANEQGKFWEYHDVLFKNQQTLEVAQLKDHANAVGLDQVKFASCLDSSKFSKTVQDDMSAGQQVGVSGTPAFFINGVMLSGAMPFDEFKRVIDQELGTN